MIKPRRMSWVIHVARMGKKSIAYIVLVGKSEGKWALGKFDIGKWTVLRWSLKK
jgi:hypothetical protein